MIPLWIYKRRGKYPVSFLEISQTPATWQIALSSEGTENICTSGLQPPTALPAPFQSLAGLKGFRAA